MSYLDHAATTPLRPEALAAMVDEYAQVGNASSLHAPGRRARRVVEEAREQIAADLGTRPGDVVFTASGTEADNLFVKGRFAAARADDPRRTVIVTSTIEHHALIDPVDHLVTDGAEVVRLPVDADARIRLDALDEVIEQHSDRIALVSLMWANNEVGTVQPIHEAAALVRAAGIPFHTDAVQAVGVLDVSVADAGVDALSLSGHKFGGPLGVGALVVDRDLALVPQLHGGGQERDLRSGTVDVPAIAGMAAALHAAVGDREASTARIEALRARLVDGVVQAVPDAVLNGDRSLDAKHRLPGNAHFSFPGCEGDALLMLLDAAGIAVSTGSACSAGVAQPSHVLLALGADEPTARSSLRFSLGWTSTEDDVEALLGALPGAVERSRAAGAVARRR